ncbi:hypothetical protein IMSHALPRED_001915 [Imshaugia aleurites]|uniref:Galactose oxidase n=1 Tax=Imshaugia aleurites TaxID=172621 RepID=A0A8H3F2C5_9LECA|nr:hypothetical protein IMSHALPRED_001915 [Imshaugia aleurites]
MATFPYNPTRILSSPASDDLIYIFQPATPGSPDSQLLALNTTSMLGATNLPYSTISPTLPFLDGPQSAYTPTIDDKGNILVYAGNCSDVAEGSTFWQFTPTSERSNLNGTWEENDLSIGGVSGNNVLDGANYLAAALAFSSTVGAPSEMYVFGGMCPNSTSSTVDNWTQAAYYSNSMLTIISESTSASTYDLGITSSRGPPIAEAGFTITPLMPTFFNSGNDSSTQSQNQNFVLLGGHTQTAFINTSQVALFSMPEQSWTFLPIDSPADAPNTDLTARDSTAIDPRSGHTALLTSDGKRVIVFGGWVGDVTNLADPQLAILELGQGYGGSGDWQWSIPSQTGPGLTDGTGIYGHGATMLPGDVMMIVGGYQIPASSGSKRRRSNPSVSGNTYFFNTTSNTWIASYTHPTIATGQRSSNSAADDPDATSKKSGLGAGLAIGIFAIIVIIVVLLWYRRQLKRQRDARQDELRNLAASAHGVNLLHDGSSPTPGRPREMTTVEWAEDKQMSRDSGPRPLGSSGYVNGYGRSEPNAERTGLLFEIPSPTRGLRRSLYSKGTYQPAPRYEDGRQTPGFSTIHPIDERDEYDEGLVDGTQSRHNEMTQRDGFNALSHVPNLDPFQDPIGGSRTPSPQSPQDRELEQRNWVSDWTVANAMMHSQVGRLSPERNDRTSSTLSDQSSRSGLSAYSIQNSVGNMSRSLSQRSAALFSTNAYRSTNDTTPSDILQGATQRYSSGHRRSRSLTLDPVSQRTAASDGFATTTGPSFPQLQSEGEALLGDYPGSGGPSPTRSHSRAKGWMGSVRRALSGLDRSASTSPENNTSNSSSPTKRNFTDGGLPRRAASTGAMPWQRRQGARDWDVEGGEQERGKRGENEQDGDEGEWDVETAVERRVVQVMFTVPKEKLRVVNRGPDGDGESTLSAEVKEDGVDDVDIGKGKEKA